MFRAIIRTDVLQSAIKAASAVVDEMVANISADGISIRAVDASNSCMTSIDIPSTECRTYEATEAELGIDLTRFAQIIGMATKSDEITLELDEDTHKLCIMFDGFAYTMAMLDPSTLRKSPTVPQLDLPAEIIVEGATFKRMIKAASMTSDHMQMGVHDETFYMVSKGDTDEVRLDLSGHELLGLKSADVSSLFSLDYLIDMGKGLGSANEVVIHLGHDLPVVIEFESSKDCPVVFVLAPRIVSD